LSISLRFSTVGVKKSLNQTIQIKAGLENSKKISALPVFIIIEFQLKEQMIKQ
jgi:hypothetical protein